MHNINSIMVLVDKDVLQHHDGPHMAEVITGFCFGHTNMLILVSVSSSCVLGRSLIERSWHNWASIFLEEHLIGSVLCVDATCACQFCQSLHRESPAEQAAYSNLWCILNIVATGGSLPVSLQWGRYTT
jgi:hypothetical protein